MKTNCTRAFAALRRGKQSLLTAALAGALAFVTIGTQAENIDTRIGKLSFTHDFANGYPMKATVEKLYDERDFQRACQAYLWAMPMVSFAEWQHAGQAVLGAGDTDVVLY